MQTPVTIDHDSACPATTVFARVVRPGSEAQYEEWLEGISETAAAFTGNQGMTILLPSGGREEYIAITHFDSKENADLWMHSKERCGWIDKLGEISIEREEVTSLTGMERWFTMPGRPITKPPPPYKTAIMIVVGLYPLALGLDVVLSPMLVDLAGALQILITLAISSSIMVWFLMPGLTRLFYRWLYPRDAS